VISTNECVWSWLIACRYQWQLLLSARCRQMTLSTDILTSLHESTSISHWPSMSFKNAFTNFYLKSFFVFYNLLHFVKESILKTWASFAYNLSKLDRFIIIDIVIPINQSSWKNFESWLDYIPNLSVVIT